MYSLDTRGWDILTRRPGVGCNILTRRPGVGCNILDARGWDVIY